MTAHEVNFDGIVGPTHNYAGLSFGNLASLNHSRQVSSPRHAALQGLDKMKFVHDLGVHQAVLPPLRRPRLDLLRSLGFEGSATRLMDAAWQANPSLLAACFSASSMWTANAATVSPSADCSDGRVHLTPANLCSGLHRSLEALETKAVLQAIFSNPAHFTIHDPLPSTAALSDEGAANHTRLCSEFGLPAVEMFVFGRSQFDKSRQTPLHFPARQTMEASQAVARLHGLNPLATVMVQQTPDAIDAGAFHNDVISVGNRNFLMYHEKAFVQGDAAIRSVCEAFFNVTGTPLFAISFSCDELPLADAVRSYVFNSQLLSRPDGGMTMLCPIDARDIATARQCTERVLAAENPVDEVVFLDLRQSMNNGGGPACLRLRVSLTDEQMGQVHSSVLFNDRLYAELTGWVKRHYRNELAPDDLRDPKLIDEVDAAYQDLSSILNLPAAVFGM